MLPFTEINICCFALVLQMEPISLLDIFSHLFLGVKKQIEDNPFMGLLAMAYKIPGEVAPYLVTTTMGRESGVSKSLMRSQGQPWSPAGHGDCEGVHADGHRRGSLLAGGAGEPSAEEIQIAWQALLEGAIDAGYVRKVVTDRTPGDITH